MRILQVIAGLHKMGGTTTFVGGLANALAKLENEVTIATYRKRNPDDEYPLDQRVQVRQIAEIEKSPGRFDVVHVHGLWDRDVFWASGWALKNNIPLVWSPHGMLAPWSLKHRWWKKFLPWHLYLKRRLKRSAVIHVTAELEKEWIEKLGLGPVVIAPLGTDLNFDVKIESKCADSGMFVVLFVGRLHPVKGLENLIKAAALIQQSSKQTIIIRLVGTDQDGYQQKLEALCKRLDVRIVTFVGAKFDDELAEEYDNCDVLVLPSYTENFGGVVIDALAHGKPVIASKFTPWQVLAGKERCGWWVDNSPESLAAAICEASERMADRTIVRMGLNGRRLVEASYTWTAVAKKMSECYNKVI